MKVRPTSNNRTVIKNDHALITGDGFVTSNIPGWSNCLINVIISNELGAGFSQILTKMQSDGRLDGKTKMGQVFFYVLDGVGELIIEGNNRNLKKGSFVHIPPNHHYEIVTKDSIELLSFHKEYESVAGYGIPSVIIGRESETEKTVFNNDPNLLMQHLLPSGSDLCYDMAINIFTYNPGAQLPFVETHIMEHGLMYLQGEGIYRLNDNWYHVKKGDSIWMAPYCPQWFGALGNEPAIYIYYKNVNRLPFVQ